MDDKSLTPDPWAAIAAELRRIADDAEALIGTAPPAMVAFDMQPYAAISHPPKPAQRDAVIEAVNVAANAFLGKDARTQKMSDGKSFHHTAAGRRGQISMSIYQAIADPDIEDVQAELKELRARIAELEADR